MYVKIYSVGEITSTLLCLKTLSPTSHLSIPLSEVFFKISDEKRGRQAIVLTPLENKKNIHLSVFASS